MKLANPFKGAASLLIIVVVISAMISGNWTGSLIALVAGLLFLGSGLFRFD